MEADNYEVFTFVTSQSPKLLFGDADVAKFNKYTNKTLETLTSNNFMHPLYKYSTLSFPLVLLTIFFTKLNGLL